MNCIDRHISYLISHHDCVIVPGFGAFVAQYAPACIDIARNTITPPARRIGFNQSLNHNDGLLASSIARASGISYDSAVATVAQQVASLRSQLQTDREVSIGHIGSFTDKGNGIIEFQPFATPIVSPNYFGLAEQPIAKVIKIAKDEENRRECAETRHRNRLSIIARNSARVAASIALLLGLGILLSTPIIVDRQAPSMASVSSVTTITPPKTTSAAALLPTNHDTTLYLAATTEGYEIADTAARNKYAASIKAAEQQKAFRAETAMTSTIRMNESDPYCLIVASLPTAEDAERYLSQSNDKSLRCLSKDGRFRIYAATGSNVTEASAPTRSSAFSKRYPGAWVCHR